MKNNKVLLGMYCTYSILVLGAVLASMGVFLLLHFSPMYDLILKNVLTIEPGTKAFEVWRTNEPPLVLDFYFFNWTNPHEIYDEDVKPKFEEVGPYRFKEVKEKYNITFHENNTVSYEFVKRYYFMGSESPRPLTDIINTVNAVALIAAYKARFYSQFKKILFSFSLSSTSRIFVTKTIEELTFAGYEDHLLNIVRPLSPFFAEGKINDKFGWLYERNDTYGISGTFSMYIANDEHFGKLVSWDYSNRTTFYEGKCGDIRGSAGEFHPMNRERDSIEIYSSEMCTFAMFEYEKDVEVKGVKAYKYSADTLFDNGTKVPDYACYCNGECMPSGVLNISSCRMNAPIFLSLPHFYNADRYYTQIIDGMKPDKNKHDFYISLEPKSAIVVDIGLRMQLNLLMQPIKGISLFQRVPKVMFPIFYFDQVLPMEDDLAFSMNLLQNLPEISSGASYILIALGVSLLIFITLNCILSSCKMRKKKRKECELPQQILTVEEIPLRIKSDI